MTGGDVKHLTFAGHPGVGKWASVFAQFAHPPGLHEYNLARCQAYCFTSMGL
jgi:hypothetical protein